MKLIQDEILHGCNNMQLAWIPRGLLSTEVMIEVRAKGEKWTASFRITVTSSKENDRLIKHGIWFGGVCHRAKRLVEISLDRLCSDCYHWGHIIKQCPYVD